MEIAYTATATPLGEALARDVEDARKKEQQTQSASIGDTVAISEEGREKQRAQASGESGDSAADKDAASGFGGNSALGKGTAGGTAGTAGAAGEEDPETEVEKIQREIRDVQTKMTDANNRLAAAQSRASAQAQSPAGQEQDAAAKTRRNGVEKEEARGADLGSATPPMPGAAIAKGDEEVQSIQAELTQLTNELMRLYEKLLDAQKSAGGSGAAGVSVG